MKKYSIWYKAEIQAKNMDEAEALAEKGEIKINSRLEKITSEDGEVLDRVYDIE